MTIVQVSVRKRPPTPYLPAWVVADALEFLVEEKVSLSYVGPLPAAIERIIAILYAIEDKELSHEEFQRITNEQVKLFDDERRLVKRVLDDIEFRFWLDH